MCGHSLSAQRARMDWWLPWSNNLSVTGKKRRINWWRPCWRRKVGHLFHPTSLCYFDLPFLEPLYVLISLNYLLSFSSDFQKEPDSNQPRKKTPKFKPIKVLKRLGHKGEPGNSHSPRKEKSWTTKDAFFSNMIWNYFNKIKEATFKRGLWQWKYIKRGRKEREHFPVTDILMCSPEAAPSSRLTWCFPYKSPQRHLSVAFVG